MAVVVFALVLALALPGAEASHVPNANDVNADVSPAQLRNATREFPFNCAAVVHDVYPNATFPAFNLTGINATVWPTVNGSAVLPNVTYFANRTVFVHNSTWYRFVLYDGLNTTLSTDADAHPAWVPGVSGELVPNRNITVWCEWYNFTKPPTPRVPDPPSDLSLQLLRVTGGGAYVRPAPGAFCHGASANLR